MPSSSCILSCVVVLALACIGRADAIGDDLITPEDLRSAEGRSKLHKSLLEPERVLDDDRFWEEALSGPREASELVAAWSSVVGSHRPFVSREDLARIFQAKRNKFSTFVSRSKMHWWSSAGSNEASSPPAGIEREYWWSPERQLVSLRFREPVSGLFARIDTLGNGASAIRTERVYLNAHPTMSTSEVGIDQLYATDEPFIQAGLLQAASFRAEPRGIADMRALLERDSTVVLRELARVRGRTCIVLAVGCPPTTRIFLSLEDDFLPFRVEHYRAEPKRDGIGLTRSIFSVQQVLETRQVDGYFSLPIRTATFSLGRSVGSAPSALSFATFVEVLERVMHFTPSPPRHAAT